MSKSAIFNKFVCLVQCFFKGLCLVHCQHGRELFMSKLLRKFNAFNFADEDFCSSRNAYACQFSNLCCLLTNDFCIESAVDDDCLADLFGFHRIDEITIPAAQKPDVSYGRIIDGKEEWAQLTKVTPSTNNLTLDSNEKIENFKTNDSLGIGMTITAMAVVFLGLLLLFLIFKQVGKAAIAASKRNAQKAGAPVNVNTPDEVSGEVFAAIATALYEMSDDNHDIEHTVLTIRKVHRAYSPWSSKIYSLRETPRK